MFIQGISAQRPAFGLDWGNALKDEIANKKNYLSTHFNTDARKEFLKLFNTNINYIKKTKPGCKIDLVNVSDNGENKIYHISGKDKSVDIFVFGEDLFYSQLAKKIKNE